KQAGRAVEMFARSVGQEIGCERRALNCFDIARVFAVENSKWILIQSLLAVLAKPRSLGGQECDQGVAIFLLALAVAHAVDTQRKIAQPAAAIKIHLKQNALDILFRFCDSKGFDAELVMLPQPTLLRTLIAKDRAEIENLDARPLIVQQTIFD